MSDKPRKPSARDTTAVRVSPALRQRLRILAAKMDVTLQEATTTVIEEGLKKLERGN